MKNANPKYYLVIVHTHENDKDFTDYALQAKSKAKAIAEAAIKAMKEEHVYSWTVYARNEKATKGATDEYKRVLCCHP